ncbi:MAG: GerMN domain-containing protein [Candidatus Eremiobacteraeota bacterium]|nr:GerMN domain-containing protein [Candidatus Eremiobacteraeota bacterium]
MSQARGPRRASRPVAKRSNVPLVLVAAVALAAIAAFGIWRYLNVRGTAADTITVYYCKTDGATLVPWKVTLGMPHDAVSIALFAANQVIAGPPSGTDAIRFPQGTVVRAVRVSGSKATVDLTGAIAKPQEGSFGESAQFKALVWTLTGIRGIDSVQILIAGSRVATLPGGHLELDQPLARSNW